MSLENNSNSRRNFIKKTTVLSIAASQPLFLSGIIRAAAGDTGYTKPTTDTTDPYSDFPDTGYDATEPVTTEPQ